MHASKVLKTDGGPTFNEAGVPVSLNEDDNMYNDTACVSCSFVGSDPASFCPWIANPPLIDVPYCLFGS